MAINYIQVVGENLKVRLLRDPTPEQVEVNSRRIEWAKAHPGDEYPDWLRHELVAAKLWKGAQPSAQLTSDGMLCFTGCNCAHLVLHSFGCL